MVRVGDYVRLGNGRKVYQISAQPEPGRFAINATALDHPDAAVRVQDAFAWYGEDQLTLVRPAVRPRPGGRPL